MSKAEKKPTSKNTEEMLVSLYELQQIESKIDEINRIKGELPFEVQDLSDDVEGAKTRQQNLTARIAELENEIKAAKNDIETAKGLIAKYKGQQDNVRNNREFESISKEIEYQELDIELAEKHIKEYTIEIGERKKQIADVKVMLADKTEALKEKEEELASIDAETEAEIAELKAKAAKVSETIDERLLHAFNTIRKGMKNGLAVVTVKRDACGGCFNRIPPQRQLDIRMSKKIIVCEYCGRILVSDQLEEGEQK